MIKGNQLETIKEELKKDVKNFVLTNKDKIKNIQKENNWIGKNLYRAFQHRLGTTETGGEIKEKSNIINEIVEKEFVNYFKKNAVKVEAENLVEGIEYYQIKHEKVTYLGAFKEETFCNINNTYNDSAPEIPVQKYIFSQENVYYSKLPNSLEPVFYELKSNTEKTDVEAEENENVTAGKRRKSRRNRKSKKGKRSRKARKSRRKSNRRR